MDRDLFKRVENARLERRGGGREETSLRSLVSFFETRGRGGEKKRKKTKTRRI